MADHWRLLPEKAPWLVAVCAATTLSCQGSDPAVVTRETEAGPIVLNLRGADQVPAGQLRLLWRDRAEEWVDPSTVAFSGTDRVAILDPPAGRVHAQARIRDLAVLGDTVAVLVRHPGTDLIELQVHVLEREAEGSRQGPSEPPESGA